LPFAAVVVGFEMEEYTAVESDGGVTLGISVSGRLGTSISIVVILSTSAMTGSASCKSMTYMFGISSWYTSSLATTKFCVQSY